MKSKEQLLSMINLAIMNNGNTHFQWFIDFSGHVNVIDVRYYRAGWDESIKNNYQPQICTIELDNKDSIQEGYWFINNKLKR